MPSFYTALFPRISTDIHLKEPKKKVTPRRGYDHNRKENRKVLLTEQQVLEARWLYEFGGWTAPQVFNHYGFTSHYCKALMSYAVRGKIVPTRDSFPSGHIPQPINSSSSPKD